MGISNILYLKEEEFIAKIVTETEEREIYSLRSELDYIAKNCLLSISEYYKLVRKKLQLKNKIPIYFSNKLLLFTLKSKNTRYLINYFNILKICYEKDIIIIIFKNGTIINVNVNRRIITKELCKINQILEYINKL